MNLRLILYFVAFAAFLGPFTQTIYTPILPEIQQNFHTSAFLVNLSISIFTLILALMQIIYGPLTDTKGRRKVLLPGIFLYVLASIGCAFSRSIDMLLVFRVIQAVGIATGSVVATTVIGDLFTGRERGRAMGTFQMFVSLGPVVGPLVGGFVGGRLGAEGVFLVLAGTGLLMWLLNWKFTPETKPETAGARFNVRDFDNILRQPIGLAVILLGFIQYYCMYNFLVFLPQILTSVYNLPAEEKGIVFLPLSIFIVVGSFIGGRIQERIEPRRLLVMTSALNVVAIVLFLSLCQISLALLMICIAIFGLCLGLSLPVQTTLLTGAFVRERATAIGVYNFFRYMGMAAGPLVGSLLYGNGRIALLFGFAAALYLIVLIFARRLLNASHTATQASRS